MKKIPKIYLSLLFTFIFLFTSFIYPINATSDLHIIQDYDNSDSLPNSFRKTTDISNANLLKSLNIKGLDKLNISGSGQFSEFNIKNLIKSIDSQLSIIDVDLREESHGFVNGTAISFANSNNSANAGLTLTEVIQKENDDLSSINLNNKLTLYNTNKSIKPKVIKNEKTLAEDNNIGYLRIPVTDGNLPNDDMTNYFINFVNNQPENTWLHFHCKAGVGRTTTFMIMYDIMKNYNEVSLHDIIARQLLLGNIKSKTSLDFFVGKRYEFLNKFYNKFKNNEYNSSSLNTVDKCIPCYTTFNDALFNSAYINGASNISSDTNVIEDDSYIKNTVIPKFLYVISENDMTKAEQTMIATLQGLIASKSENQIYILSPSEHDYEIWLKDLKKNYNVKYKKVKDPWSLLDKFKKYIHGYTLYSTVKGPSINNACTLASLNDSIAIDESIEKVLNSYGITNLLEDCRETDKYWAYNTLWNSGLNHSTVIELPSDKFISLRDYAILSKSLIFYEDDVNDTSFREAIFSSMDNGGRILGWGPDEHTNVSIASKCGIDMIAADWSYNLSVLSSYKSTPQSQNIKNDIKEEDGVHYITFIMSDGDNMQWLLGSNFSMKNWFGSPNRGNFNLGWSITPSLYYLAPTVFNKYYSSASSSKYSDNFVVSASGNGYMYPSKFPYEKLSNYTNRLNDYMSKVDQNYVLILDDEAFYKKDLWDKYTCNSNIDALLYLNYDINNAYKGKIIWSNDKPVISCRDLLWGGLEDENELISNINNRINSGYTNIKDPNLYTFVYVHVWSNTMDNVNDAINKLNKNPKVKIVTPDTFIKLIRNNVPHVDI